MKLLNKIFNFFVQKILFEEYCCYINGPETLPPPLSREDEEFIINQIKNGNDENRDLLITHNLRLVVYIAKKYESKTAGAEDLVSIGTIGLMKAVKTYNPEKNIKLATYASRCIENEILMYLRKASNSKTEMSFDEPLSVDLDGNELTLRDVLGSEPDEISQSIEYEDEKRLLRYIIANLSQKEKHIMEQRFGLNGAKSQTQKELADNMGISQSYISRLEKRILAKIKDEMENHMAIK
ncbi:MAG: RNA polymerase sporulation sigma factor SigK [Eubacterium sp.]|nr:RNA polymerase sporulation sigma factor SigK [Eubacterium sp.]